MAFPFSFFPSLSLSKIKKVFVFVGLFGLLFCFGLTPSIGLAHSTEQTAPQTPVRGKVLNTWEHYHLDAHHYHHWHPRHHHHHHRHHHHHHHLASQK